ncbi:hypothetical protein VFPPC_04815 [Pochonia chlamydosporia 170]|uniref:Uncharacterized protein n=1 Tax=Pochonia chlamydosporia 170 TaxID=1380566 RepID=A0A179FU28_METCM|nr:hypothetical protein VFPPC_04815 [Pochonia chlamydosporia 170]OAQ68593.1 hypothetical protein VFPPC_04815 [Pochonia chlamydosporia 170]
MHLQAVDKQSCRTIIRWQLRTGGQLVRTDGAYVDQWSRRRGKSIPGQLSSCPPAQAARRGFNVHHRHISPVLAVAPHRSAGESFSSSTVDRLGPPNLGAGPRNGFQTAPPIQRYLWGTQLLCFIHHRAPRNTCIAAHAQLRTLQGYGPTAVARTNGARYPLLPAPTSTLDQWLISKQIHSRDVRASRQCHRLVHGSAVNRSLSTLLSPPSSSGINAAPGCSLNIHGATINGGFMVRCYPLPPQKQRLVHPKTQDPRKQAQKGKIFCLTSAI